MAGKRLPIPVRATRGGALAGTIEDQKLMHDELRFGDDGTSTVGSEQAGERYDQMDEKKSEVALNPDSLPSAQPCASLGFCLDLGYELRICHQQVKPSISRKVQLPLYLAQEPCHTFLVSRIDRN